MYALPIVSFQYATSFLKKLCSVVVMQIRRNQHCVFVLCFNNKNNSLNHWPLFCNYMYQLIRFNTNCTSHHSLQHSMSGFPSHACNKCIIWNLGLCAQFAFVADHSPCLALLLPRKAWEGGCFWYSLCPVSSFFRLFTASLLTHAKEKRARWA